MEYTGLGDPGWRGPFPNIRDAAQVMTSGHFRHLPVVGDAGLVGIVHITDVCRALLESDVSGTPETVAGRSA